LTTGPSPRTLPRLTHSRASSEALRGGLSAAGGFVVWGLVPLYWRQMQSVAAIELIAHRIVWSLAVLLGVIAWRGRFASLRPAFADGRTVGANLASGLLLAANWTIFVWAVNSGHILEASLGYFLTPLGNVAMGRFLLHERLRPLQTTAIGFAAAGVGLLLVGVGHPPWIALSIAVTWSGYAYMKKRTGLDSIASLTAETLLLFPAATALLLWRQHTGTGALGRVDAWQQVLVLSAGIVTAIPLLLFGYGAQRLRLATLGLLQYIVPTVQFVIGLLVYREPFDSAHLSAYALIWCGLILYSGDTFWSQRHKFRN
jgi:chloramphenicol-sensitive protein RarD